MNRLLLLIIFTISLIINKYLQAMNDIFLTNGNKENRFLVAHILNKLQKLLNANQQNADLLPILSLIVLCRHREHSAATAIMPMLQKYDLVDEQGYPSNSVKNVVESAIEIEPFKIKYKLITKNNTTPMDKWLTADDNRNHQIRLASPIRKRNQL